MTPVDVKQVKQLRRKMHFDAIADVLLEARRLVDIWQQHGEYQVAKEDWPPARSGVAYLANLNLGQTLEHIARWFDASLEMPFFKPPPAPLRWLARHLRGRIMRGPLPLGFILPADAEAIFIPPPETDPIAALAHLEASAARLAATSDRAPSRIFGPLAATEWDQMHLRHAELHLGYMSTVTPPVH